MADPGQAATTVGDASGARRRMSLVTVDNLIFSISSLLVFIWAAHVLDPADFGRFALVLLVFVFVQGSLVRSLVSWTVMVHPEDADSRPRAVLGSALMLAAVAGAICLAAGGLLQLGDSGLGSSLLVVGALMPLLAVQEVGRFISFAQAKPSRAIVIDVLWLVLMIAALWAIQVRDTMSLTWMVIAWGGSGALAGVWVFVQQGWPRPQDISLAWLKDRWGFSWRSLVAASSSAVVALVGAGLVAVVSGPVAVAAVRAALLLERPSTTIQMAVATSTGAEIARERPDNAGLLVHQRRALLVSVVVAAVNFAVLFLIPDSVGELILGDVWDLVTPLLLIIGLRVLAMAGQSGVRAALMGRRQISRVMKIDIAGTVLSIVGFVIGAYLGDAEGAYWGSLIGLTLTVIGWWWALITHLRSGETYPDSEPEVACQDAADPADAVQDRPVI